MYNFEKFTAEQINWLASAKFIPFTYQISETMGEVRADGRKIVKSGTVFPSDDANAIGIVLNDIDVTNGDQAGSVLVEAWVLEERLPKPVSDEAKAAMTEIKFKKVI